MLQQQKNYDKQNKGKEIDAIESLYNSNNSLSLKFIQSLLSRYYLEKVEFYMSCKLIIYLEVNFVICIL